MSYSFTNWMDRFGDQVSKQREALTGQIVLLYDSEIDRIPDMDGALFQCYCERIAPKIAAQRFVALTS